MLRQIRRKLSRNRRRIFRPSRRSGVNLIIRNPNTITVISRITNSWDSAPDGEIGCADGAGSGVGEVAHVVAVVEAGEDEVGCSVGDVCEGGEDVVECYLDAG
jgi:hypothetical protein